MYSVGHAPCFQLYKKVSLSFQSPKTVLESLSNFCCTVSNDILSFLFKGITNKFENFGTFVQLQLRICWFGGASRLSTVQVKIRKETRQM